MKRAKLKEGWPTRLNRLGLKPMLTLTSGWYELRRAEVRAALSQARTAALDAESLRLEAIEAARPRCPVCTEKLPKDGGPCAKCQVLRFLEISLASGGVYQIKGAKYKIVEISNEAAAMCEYTNEVRRIEDAVCGVFRHPSGTLYAQPISVE